MTKRRVLASLAFVSVLGSACSGFKRWGYDGFGRDRWQKPDRVVSALQIAPGARVADLGAGGGYFTFRLADAVGPDGRVYAVDVDPDMTGYLSERAREESRSNVEVILARTSDPLLPADGVDLIFTSNTYHHLENRPAYFAGVKRYLRPGGRVAIVEHLPKGWFRLFPHATTAETIRSEMEAGGYKLVREHDFLERQSFLVFAPDGAR
jgi:ubiquinone/menaquinone biosynthesis C-methylase UbiE